MASSTEESRMRQLNVRLIFTIGLLSSILLLVIIIGTMAWYHYEVGQFRAERVYGAQNTWLIERDAEQRARLEEVRWRDEERTRATMPIEEAMEQYVRMQRGD